ncbi:DUF5995 family protein [Streptomyces sp. NPDC050421]|uniref:DUF5995 family protein n=1 Tax=unclassified Streptomyces TaxID=2593676 RepID=UPI00379E7C44
MAQFEQLEQVANGPAAEPARTGTGTVIERMHAFRPSSGRGEDGVAVFHRVYLAAQGGPGGEAGAASGVLAVRLAERYLSAVDTAAAGHRIPDCWRPLFQYRRHPGVRPLQFALAGLNAHAGHDLALAVVDTCRTLRCAPTDLEEEFDRVGDLLLMLEERIGEDLMPERPAVTDPLTHLVGSWNLERAREAAWSAARVLWRLREVPSLAAEFGQQLDAGAGLVGRCLLTPCR